MEARQKIKQGKEVSREFTCENCQGVFTSEWSTEEAEAEAVSRGVDIYEKHAYVVCTDCYKAIMKHAIDTGLHVDKDKRH